MSSIEKRIREIIEKNVDLEIPINEVKLDTPLAEIGINSISYIKTIVAIENEFDIEFSDEDLKVNEKFCFQNLIDYVQNKIDQGKNNV